MTASIARRPFGETDTGEQVELFTLTSCDGLEVAIITYGAAVQSVLAPARDGSRANVALGFPTLGGYMASSGHFFGATIGRYANRIAGGRFVLDGVVHELSRNDGDNCLHGGARGFHTQVWDVLEASGNLVALRYTSLDGEMGFPGELETRVEFRLDGAELRIDYRATTSAPTVVNPTNHTCWNLAGARSGSVADHVLRLAASSFTPVDRQLIPTGDIAAVDGTPFDFRDEVAIGARGRDYDDNFVLDRDDDSLVVVSRVREPVSGRVLDVLTTEPGIQLYTGTSLDRIALETQHFPDSPNQPAFPSTTLRPDETFESTTVYRFAQLSPSELSAG